MVSVEFMLNTPAVRNMIREGKEHQLYSVLQTGLGTIDQAVRALGGHDLPGCLRQGHPPVGVGIQTVRGQALTGRGDELDVFHAHIQFQNRRQPLERGDHRR